MSVQAVSPKRLKYSTSFYLRWMLAIMLFTLLWELWTASFWFIKEVRFESQPKHTRTFIQNYLKQQGVVGQHLLSLHPMDIQKALLNNKILQDIRVERRLFPAALVIKLRERQPAFAVALLTKDKPAENAVIDLEGQVLPLESGKVRLPENTLHFSLTKSLVKGKISEKHMLVLHQLNDLSKTLHFPEGVIDLSQPQNLVLTTPIAPAPVWLGDTQFMARKLELLPSVIELAKKKTGTKAYLDLRFWKHPVIRMKTN